MKLKDKVAVITGGSSGFGAAFAHRFYAEGASVAVADIDADNGERLVRDLGSRAVFIKADVSRESDVAAMVAATVERFRRLDIVMNNAGIASPKEHLVDQDEAFFDKLFAVNVKSMYLVCRHAVPALKLAKGGCIINTASTSALKPRPQNVLYAASKGAILSFTKALSVELAPDNIRVNALTPVAARTPLFMDFVGSNSENVIADIESRIPLGRLCEPKDMAACAAFLASDEAAYLTGVSLPVDGGWTAS